MLKLPYSAPTACVGWFSDPDILLSNCTWGGSCVLVTMSFEVVVPVVGFFDVQ